MDGYVILLILIAIFIWVSFFRKINPSNKTDEQLYTLYNMAVNAGEFGVKKRKLIEEEMERRGLFGNQNADVSELIKQVSEDYLPRIIVKIAEISDEMNVSGEEAHKIFEQMVEDASSSYQELGESSDDAYSRAFEYVLNKKFETA